MVGRRSNGGGQETGGLQGPAETFIESIIHFGKASRPSGYGHLRSQAPSTIGQDGQYQ